MATRPECVGVLFDELATTAGRTPGSTSTSRRCASELESTDAIEYRARKVAEDISLALQGSLLCATVIRPSPRRSWRPGWRGNWGGAFGTLPTGLDLAPILERCMVRDDVPVRPPSRRKTPEKAHFGSSVCSREERA